MARGEESQRSHAIGVTRHERLVHADTGVVVNITGLGHTDDGVDEDVGLTLTGSSNGELTMSTVHGVTGLESDHLAPSDLGKVLTKLGGGVTESDVVVVSGLGDGLNLTTDVELLDRLVKVGDGGVGQVIGTKDGFGLANLVNGVDIADSDDGDGIVVTRVAQSNAGTLLDLERLHLLLVDIEGDGHGKKVAIGQTHGVEAPVVVGLVHEALQRGEATVDDEFEIAKLTLGEDELGERVGFLTKLSSNGSIANEQVLEDTTVRSVGHDD